MDKDGDYNAKATQAYVATKIKYVKIDFKIQYKRLGYISKARIGKTYKARDIKFNIN